MLSDDDQLLGALVRQAAPPPPLPAHLRARTLAACTAATDPASTDATPYRWWLTTLASAAAVVLTVLSLSSQPVTTIDARVQASPWLQLEGLDTALANHRARMAAQRDRTLASSGSSLPADDQLTSPANDTTTPQPTTHRERVADLRLRLRQAGDTNLSF